jgi:hypothetical protein
VTIDSQAATERSCLNLLTRFYFSLDARAYDDTVSVFSDGGSWVRFGEPLVGVPAIRMKLDQRPANVEIRHILSNLHFSAVSAEAAHSRGYVTVYVGPFVPGGSEPAPLEIDSLLVLDTDYALTAKGWRISKHDGVFVMRKKAPPPR